MQEPDSIKKVPTPQILDVAKALSSELRLRILEALGHRPMSITELAGALGAAQPTVSINISMLEEAGLVSTTTQGLGRSKLCSRTSDELLLLLPKIAAGRPDTETVEMPVGLFTDIQGKPSCGLVGMEGLIGNADEPASFFLPERQNAMLLWFSEDGYVEYRFPNLARKPDALQELSVSVEICSEAWGYNENWPSDITLSVNGVEVGMWTSPGDFGETKGTLTPGWWHGATQYGMLTEWTVREAGGFLNGARCSEVTTKSLLLDDRPDVTIRFAVKPDAGHKGGLNLFGRQFGNVPQDIRMTFVR